MRKLSDIDKQAICDMYVTGRFTVLHIARTFRVGRRTIQYVVKAKGLSRTQAEANRVAAALQPKHRIRRRL